MGFQLKSGNKLASFKMMGNSPLLTEGHKGSDAPGHPAEHDYNRWENKTSSEGEVPGNTDGGGDKPQMSEKKWAQFLKDNPGWGARKENSTYGFRGVEPLEPLKPGLIARPPAKNNDPTGDSGGYGGNVGEFSGKVGIGKKISNAWDKWKSRGGRSTGGSYDADCEKGQEGCAAGD